MLKNHKNVLSALFWMLFFTIIFLLVVDHYLNFINEKLNGNPADIRHIEAIHHASLIILTFILACIAWIQLGGINKTGQGDFLLRIDERFGNTEIIKAREIIHFIYAESKKEDKKTEEQHCEFIANYINDLGENYNDIDKMKQYICLLNFLDFLETVSLFGNEGYISIELVNDLMNQSLIFFFTIFKKRIDERRWKYKDPSFYIQFEKLVKRLECQKKHCYILCPKCFFNF